MLWLVGAGHLLAAPGLERLRSAVADQGQGVGGEPVGVGSSGGALVGALGQQAAGSEPIQHAGAVGAASLIDVAAGRLPQVPDDDQGHHRLGAQGRDGFQRPAAFHGLGGVGEHRQLDGDAVIDRGDPDRGEAVGQLGHRGAYGGGVDLQRGGRVGELTRPVVISSAATVVRNRSEGAAGAVVGSSASELARSRPRARRSLS